MKTLKKNNKGFSLVELIVVILIMAIIAVALAPQVMKWVDESKVSADNSNKATIKSAVDAAVADYMSDNKSVADAGEVFFIFEGKMEKGSVGSGAVGTAVVDNPSGLEDYIAEVLNVQYLGVEQVDGGCFRVNVDKHGAVTVTICDASGEDLPSGSGT